MTTQLRPCHLVMKPESCFYCSAKCTGEIIVFDLFGLRHCSTHKAQAHQDCRSYCHEHKIVMMPDAMNIPVVASLFDLLRRFPFYIRRSNGHIESGWAVDYGPNTIIRYGEKYGWYIPVISMTDNYKKSVPISGLLDPETSNFPEGTEELVDNVTRVLESGIYTVKS